MERCEHIDVFAIEYKTTMIEHSDRLEFLGQKE